MASNNKRRDASRRELEARLRERQAREARKRRLTLIGSVIGSVVVVAVVVILVVVLAGGGNDKQPAASSKTPSATPTSATASSSAPPVAPAAACTSLAGKSVASFEGVTVKDFTNTAKQPTVTSKGTTDPKTLACADLVVGTGAAATPTSMVSVHYTGVLYKNGTLFDSSYKDNKGPKPTSFSLTGVVPGFTQGIGGAGPVKPMRVGGVRILLVPPALGYGSQASGPIPANSTLVFIVHLVKA